MKSLFGAIGGLAVAFVCGSANAAIVTGQSIGVDFGTTPSNNNFNNSSVPAPDTLGSLIDLTGAPVAGVGFSISGSGQNQFSNSDGAIGTVTGLPAPFNASNYADFTGTYSGPTPVLTLTFTGLDDALTYNFVGVSAFKGGNYDHTFASGLATSAIVNSQQDNPSANLNGLTTNGAGSLSITVNDVNNGNAFVNAVTLTAVPEPTSLGLLAAGTLGLLANGRRLRRRA